MKTVLYAWSSVSAPAITKIRRKAHGFASRIKPDLRQVWQFDYWTIDENVREGLQTR